MASIRSIRKRGQLDMWRKIWVRALLAKMGPWHSFDSVTAAILFMRELRAPEHLFAVGQYATRCGSGVHKVDSVAGNCADFRCIKAPQSGWCAVGDVEHNLMRRYPPLSPDEVEAMLAQAPHAAQM